MLTDILTKGGMKVPRLEGVKAGALLSKLHPGSSVSNPIDFLATGNAKQLGEILDAMENDFENIDGSIVVFGTTGMWSVDDVYMVLHEKMRSCQKPIFPILPSAIQAAEEVSHFHAMGHVNFTDEVSFGYVLTRVNKMQPPYEEPVLPVVDEKKIREIIDNSDDGYLDANSVFDLLNAAGIPTIKQSTVHSPNSLKLIPRLFEFPLVLKVVGPLHKSDVGGVITGINNLHEMENAYRQLMKIDGAEAVLVQEQFNGLEIYMGVKAEDEFGHQALVGLGGIFVEVFKDVSAGLVPLGKPEALSMIRHLRSYPVIKRIRGKEGVSEDLLAETLMKLSALVKCAPEIEEMDINPLMGRGDRLVAVDARIRIVKTCPE